MALKLYKDIIKNYDFTQSDVENLKKLFEIFPKYEDSFLDGFYKFIFTFEYATKFIKDEETQQRHQQEIGKWYLRLFSGVYDDSYFEKLYIISDVHVKIGLPHHYVNAAFSYVRRFLKDVLIKENCLDLISSVDKIVDINLDILTVTYSKTEQAKLLDDIVFLRECKNNNKIIPYFQAIYDTKSKKISKYESLMRLEKDDKSVVSIFPYLKIAKDIKIYDGLTKIMILKTFTYMRDKICEFSVNLDYEDLSNRSLVDFILKFLEDKKFASRVIFEIVESEFIDDFKIAENFAKQVREKGSKIAIDDFGSGFSSMENILKLKPEIIKIDGSLIKDLDKSKEHKILVKNILAMAKDLGSVCVAEYVHSKEIFDICVDMEVDFLQGFYLHEPKKDIET